MNSKIFCGKRANALNAIASAMYDATYEHAPDGPTPSGRSAPGTESEQDLALSPDCIGFLESLVNFVEGISPTNFGSKRPLADQGGDFPEQ